jgi:hypothetical protein
VAELRAVLFADHVRQEGNAVHVLAANVDGVHTSQLPAFANLAVLFIIAINRDEAGIVQKIRGELRPLGGDTVAAVEATTEMNGWDETLPTDWISTLAVGMNVSLPVTSYGPHLFDVWLNGNLSATLGLRVLPVS